MLCASVYPGSCHLELNRQYIAQSQTATVIVDVERFNGANNAVNLAVSGLPNGVTVTGANVIPAGSDATELTFAVAPNAPVSSSEYTITATSAGVRGSVSAKGLHDSDSTRSDKPLEQTPSLIVRSVSFPAPRSTAVTPTTGYPHNWTG